MTAAMAGLEVSTTIVLRAPKAFRACSQRRSPTVIPMKAERTSH
eukprot:CAMPEP_0182469552 /NCGR_PEP_ID=MMETSP1319-20130603/17265_1 /TAXON_ID=172717 /ORGANISM="Bolidomonas pacifica, Strain RCC208" /LENGTH=43 /DNA_ID= /DNA_START= /DNA_END= /DNA_ORIENTATION=